MAVEEKNLQLRIKTKNGQSLIDSLKPSNSIGELKSVLWSVTNIHPNNCRFLIGYPPEEVFFVDDNLPIQNIIKNTKEILTIDELPPNNQDSLKSSNSKLDEFSILNQPKKMERIEVPANNSCLFVSVYFCLTGQMQEKCPELRNLIAETVRNDPITYNEGFLGKPNHEYCDWIRNEDHWGGGIELSILSNYYQVEIVAVDTQSLKLHRFGEDKFYPIRIFLIFDGIHYDPMVVYCNRNENPIQTSFSSDDTNVFDLALDVARKAKANHQYTDLNRMNLKCNQCQKRFTQKEARSHASSTGHTDFIELKGQME
ncbi:SERAC1-like protein [Sarcoptes scabiei]|nr:SERAC1-like protein [Sarcoptes scabiei]